MDIEIKNMNKIHLAGVAEIEIVCFSQPWSLENLCESFDNPLYCFFVAIADGEPVGYIGGYSSGDDWINVTNLAVLPKCRRRGIGGDLLSALAKHAKEIGFEAITLEVRVSNAPAIALYRTLKFEILGIRPRFYQSPEEDAYIMIKKLVTN